MEIVVDYEPRVLISDVESPAIGIAMPSAYEITVQDNVRLAWPDGFVFGPDGWLCISQNQLHGCPVLNAGIRRNGEALQCLQASGLGGIALGRVEPTSVPNTTGERNV